MIRLILFVIINSLSVSVIGQDQCCLPNCGKPNSPTEKLFYCYLDSLNAYESIHFLTDSTFSYSHTHDWFDYVLYSSGKYVNTNDTIILNAKDGNQMTQAINMKLIFIKKTEIYDVNPRFLFCNFKGKYLLLLSNENNKPIEFRKRLTDPMLH